MPLDLSSYSAIQTNLFVKVDIPDYDVLTFSDYHKSYSLSGTNYTGLGQLLVVTNTTSNLRATSQELSVTISGIPEANIPDILDNKVKGSRIEVYRAFFDTVTGEILSITGNPAGKFRGVVSNFDITDDLRRTNPADEKLFFPSDLSMDRVPSLAKSNFNFGAPK